jgi:hypothetical protein
MWPVVSGRRIRLGFAILSALVATAAGGETGPAPISTSTVGMPARIDQIVLPGPELEARPIEGRRDPVVLRVVASYPHGSAFRYDLSYHALEPGDYDLRSYLRRKDGAPTGDLPPVPVRVDSLLAEGRLLPHAVPLRASPRFVWYRALAWAAGTLWALGLAYLLYRGRRAAQAPPAEARAPLTLADRLRPLVASAIEGDLDPPRRAELERLLIGHWRERLGLEGERPTELMAALRRHDEAGPLFQGLEDWLHRPERERIGRGDELAALLRPYLDDRDAHGPPPAGATARDGGHDA